MKALLVLPLLLGAGESPYRRPEFARLMDAVTFHASFDRGSMMPDMAEGEPYAPQVRGSHDKSSPAPRFAPGLAGQALVLGSGAAIYPRAGNVLLERRGALACWVRPEGWERPNDRNVVFVMTSNASFYLERQGPLEGTDGRVRRHEGVLYIARQDDRMVSVTAHEPWQNGRWYLLVANWTWPTFQLSVDGEPVGAKSLAGMPKPDAFGALVVGDSGAGARGLLDEVMAFRRPLSQEEAMLLLRLKPGPSASEGVSP